MWRTLKIACVNCPVAERVKLGGLLARLGLQEQIDHIGVDGAEATERKEDSFDIVFVNLGKRREEGLETITLLRDASKDAVFILFGEHIGLEDVSAALNRARVDWILPRGFSDVELKDALTWAIDKLEERRRRREMEIGREILSATRTPAAILDRSYRIVFANRSAGDLFAMNDPFQITGASQLVCANSSQTQKFHRELSGSLHKHLQRRENAFIRVERDKERKPVVVVSIPKRGTIDNLYTYHIVLNDLERQNTAFVDDYAIALNLSAAEARLTHALARGLGLEEACLELNISVNTARGYLKSVFEKTGVTRQAELVRLALLALK